jgi:polyhydroxybutyrate depolymerase
MVLCPNADRVGSAAANPPPSYRGKPSAGPPHAYIVSAVEGRRGPRRLVRATGVGALAAGACIAFFAAGGATASAGSASGCGSNSGSTTMTATFSGHQRTVIVHVPSGYKKSAKVPLVLNMHGSGATARDQELFTAMDATADANGFIVAYPQGLIPEASGFDWNVPGVPLIGGAPVPSDAANDVSFLTQLVGVLEQRYCIDPTRVYATGFSGGARIASQLACDSSSVFAAVAPVSGLRRPTPCPASRAVPIISFHGTADPVDPYAGHGQAYWTYSVPQAAADWASEDGCSSKPTTTHSASTVTVTIYGHCRGGAEVELYTISGEGHEWPGGPTLPKSLSALLGRQSNAVNADAVMWAFFKSHPLS